MTASKREPSNGGIKHLGNIQQARHFKSPLVYALCDVNLNIVYVGQTKNAYKRFGSYASPNACHNENLKNWLLNNAAYVIALDIDPKDINQSEKFWIKKLEGQLFNLISGGAQSWRNHKTMPWMAGIGIGCPSAIILQHLNRNGFKWQRKEMLTQIIISRNSMNVVERCVFEISLCKEILLNQSRFKAAAEKWLSITSEKMIFAMVGSNG